MTYNSKAEIEAEIAKLQKLLADFHDEPDYEALRPAVQAYYASGVGLSAVCENPMDDGDTRTARALLAAYPHLKAYHEAREAPSEPEWIEWGPDSEGYPNCPVPAGPEFEVKFRGDSKGYSGYSIPPERWEHLGLGGDIIAYRIIPAGDAR